MDVAVAKALSREEINEHFHASTVDPNTLKKYTGVYCNAIAEVFLYDKTRICTGDNFFTHVLSIANTMMLFFSTVMWMTTCIVAILWTTTATTLKLKWKMLVKEQIQKRKRKWLKKARPESTPTMRLEMEMHPRKLYLLLNFLFDTIKNKQKILQEGLPYS
jgi:hypothetical protein